MTLHRSTGSSSVACPSVTLQWFRPSEFHHPPFFLVLNLLLDLSAAQMKQPCLGPDLNGGANKLQPSKSARTGRLSHSKPAYHVCRSKVAVLTPLSGVSEGCLLLLSSRCQTSRSSMWRRRQSASLSCVHESVFSCRDGTLDRYEHLVWRERPQWHWVERNAGYGRNCPVCCVIPGKCLSAGEHSNSQQAVLDRQVVR